MGMGPGAMGMDAVVRRGRSGCGCLVVEWEIGWVGWIGVDLYIRVLLFRWDSLAVMLSSLLFRRLDGSLPRLHM